jgi:hypothetical protein
MCCICLDLVRSKISNQHLNNLWSEGISDVSIVSVVSQIPYSQIGQYMGELYWI